jgi:hypothetical protein
MVKKSMMIILGSLSRIDFRKKEKHCWAETVLQKQKVYWWYNALHPTLELINIAGAWPR